jgi:hypothetical protein
LHFFRIFVPAQKSGWACHDTSHGTPSARAKSSRGTGISKERPSCLGLCHSSPAAILDNHVHGMLDAAKLDALVKEAQS